MSLFHLRGLRLLPHKLNSVTYVEHLAKFHLDLCIPRYSNYTKVFYLGMNARRGWNPDLEESYLPEYSEFEAETFTQGTSRIIFQHVNVSDLDPSPIYIYSECTKTTSFSILGFFRPESN